jgi:Flp pilus assembly protein TadD
MALEAGTAALLAEGRSRLLQGNVGGARESFDLAAKNSPDDLQVPFDIGNAWYEAGDAATAVEWFRRAQGLDPRCVEVHYNLGVALQELQRDEEAEQAYRAALSSRADYVPALNNLGIVLRRLRRYGEALVPALRAAELAPQDAEVLNNLGQALADLGHMDEAEASYREALRLRRDYPEAWGNRGVALTSRGELDEAVECFEAAIRLRPGDADAHLNLAHALLLQGKFERGWDEYEQRLSEHCGDSRSAIGPRRHNQRAWQGEDLNGGTLLLWAEQGLGDQILFAGVIPELLARGGRLIVECDPRLVALFQRSFPAVRVVPRQDPPAAEAQAADWQLALGSLPRHFRRTPGDFPSHGGYLRADPARAAAWGERLGKAGKLRVGLNWAGNPAFRNDRWRSASLADFAPLGEVSDVEWFNLHQGARRNELEIAPFHLRDYAGEWRDMDDTAAFMANLDLVISTCTVIPHLAGALGKPVWVLVHGLPYWAWGGEGSATPWYPSARVFRQGQRRGWGAVVADVAQALEELVSP